MIKLSYHSCQAKSWSVVLTSRLKSGSGTVINMMSTAPVKSRNTFELSMLTNGILDLHALFLMNKTKDQAS